jgi:cholesterol transport system auxiliary component
MTRPAYRIGRRWLVGGATLALAGCASLIVATPPGNLYRLMSASNYPTNLPHVRTQLLVDLPEAPAAIDTSRIALSKSSLSFDYYANSEWTDRVPDLIQNLLLASFENSAAITAVDRESTGLRADFLLRTEIRHFEAVYSAVEAPPRVWVAIIGRLVAMPQRTIIAQARFEERVSASADNVPAIVAAFDTATDAVLRDIVLWTLTNPALSQSRR